jgi:imidazolonepropionase-like amidohydrolase
MTVTDALEARRAVQELKHQGADFAKVYALLSREAYFALADEAGKQKLPFAGHVPASVTVEEAAQAGQQSIEHLYRLSREYFGDRDRAPAMVDALLENGTWVVPTLILEHGALAPNADDERRQYLPLAVQRMWDLGGEMLMEGMPGVRMAISRLVDERNRLLVGALHRAGVRLLAGTDTASWNRGTFPGFSLHDELALLVEAGLTPMQALQAATLNPARFLGKEQEFGTVLPGRRGDLVLLDADPLQDIHNTRKIHAVMLGGRLLDRRTLDRMLAEVKAAAAPRP